MASPPLLDSTFCRTATFLDSPIDHAPSMPQLETPPVCRPEGFFFRPDGSVSLVAFR